MASLGLLMTPYYQDDKARIYNESCVRTLQRLEDDSIDVVVTSPPYNMNLRIRNGEYCSRQIVKEFSTKYEEFDDNLPINEYYTFHSNILKELLRVSDLVFYNIAVVTGSKRSVFKMIGEYADYLKDIIIWDKGHGQPAMADNVLNRRTELILVFEKHHAISRQFVDQAQFDRGTLDDIWLIKRQRSQASSNTAVFPEELVQKILENFSEEGDLIYDPFMGTGTTAVVASRMGRNSIGSEISKSLIDVAKMRLSQGTLW